ncbi:MAG: (2Fe-2S)-binding protein [Polaromonas sp.]|uniref:(2Fe-2S)-binding protein n=1 Tax=Polaromonas sp. TaxID=1869339 RepID=UPI002732B2DC|nr:(2Fe-2S)-binding protein [Polaromonas sp.]MDP2817393.1 (2Fe-2S)-binding protein [Polaromonas sp.]
MNLDINGKRITVDDGWRDETLLSVLREALGLVGAKFGCGVGLCGACTVLVDGQAQRSCLLQAADLAGAKIATIEGLSRGDELHPVQRAWLDESVPQCGYCQTGQIMSVVALLRVKPKPDDTDIDAALAGNLCRCGTQQRIRRAVHRAAKAAGGGAA